MLADKAHITKNLKNWEGINCLQYILTPLAMGQNGCNQVNIKSVGNFSYHSKIRYCNYRFWLLPCISKINKVRCINDHLQPSVIVFLPSKGGVVLQYMFYWWISPTNPSDCLCFCLFLLIIWIPLPIEHHPRNPWNLVWDLLQYLFWMAFLEGSSVLAGWGSVWIQ